MKSPKDSVLIDVGKIENTCFVVMPFDPLFQIQYERIIRPAIEELGLKCVRGDELYSKPNVMADIWKELRKARLVVAELTGKNANVFYEIGLAHAIGKPIILLTRNEDDVPFDLKALRYRYYDVNDPFWGDNLRNSIQSMVKRVLEQSDLAAYLDGITPYFDIPVQPQEVDLNSQSVVSFPDISGNWKAAWNSEPEGMDVQMFQDTQSKGIVHITQQGENLSATMTITVENLQSTTVIQEVLTGRIQGKRITFSGISYTYIHQGSIENYFLDNFDLILSEDAKTMVGKQYDGKFKGQATFSKQENL